MLLKKAGIIKRSFDISHCPHLLEYMEKVPADDFHYVFASENLHSVTSMMGHGFLVSKGVDQQAVKRAHTFSFFAEFEERNPLLVFYKAFFSGLEGRFMVRPYQRDKTKYLRSEKRELWDHQLAFSRDEKEFLRLALWELRYVAPRYFFHSFNCATLTFYAIAIIEPKIVKFDLLFVTPLDLVKALHQLNRIEFVNVTLPEPAEEFYKDQLNLDGEDLDFRTLSKLKNPIRSSQDSMISIGIAGKKAEISFLPASHRLRTLSKNRVRKGELKIGEITLSSASPYLESVAVYSFKDYVNPSAVAPSTSTEFFAGYRPVTAYSDVERAGDLAWLGGRRFPLATWDLFVLGGAGIRGKDSPVYASLRLGFAKTFSENFGINAQSLYRVDKTSGWFLENVLELSFGLETDLHGFLRAKTSSSPHWHGTEIGLGLDIHF